MALWSQIISQVRDLYGYRIIGGKAYAAIDKEYEAARTFANAKSEAHLSAW